MAYWNKTLKYTNSREEIIRLGGGVNTELTPFEIKENEAVDSSNTGSKNYPALSTREGNTIQFSTDTILINNFNGAGVRNNSELHIIDGTTWKRWDGSAFVPVKTALTSTKGVLVELNTQAKRYMFMFNGSEKYAYDGSTVVPITDAPDSSLVAVDDNRIFTIKNGAISYCAATDPFDWTTNLDAGEEVIVGMLGTETAIAAYNDAIIVWSDSTMHIMYGDTPLDFTPKNPIRAGCVSNNSVVEHKGVLYFMDYNAFKRFTGGMPEKISDKIDSYLKNINYDYKHLICSGAKDDYIYVSIPYGAGATTNNMTIRYDVGNRTWYPSHDKGYLQFINIGNDIYGVNTSGQVEKLEDDTTNNASPISWYHITKIFSAIPIKARKTIREYWMCVDLQAGSTLNVAYSETAYGNDFVSLYDFTAETDTQYSVIMIPTDVLQEVNKYRLKLSGTGPCTIHYLEPHMRIKSR